MKALTLWRPWARYVSTGEKRIENRPWAPPAKMLGETIAIHAGKAWEDAEGIAMIDRVLGRDSSKDSHVEGIIGTVKLVGWFHFDGEITASELTGVTECSEQDDEWCFGPVCWVLRDFTPIAAPIPCRGMQKLWNIPADVQLKLDAAVLAAHEEQADFGYDEFD